MKLKIEKTAIADLFVFKPEIYSDKRGILSETYNKFLFDKLLDGINFIQDNESVSQYGVIRGLHFQKKPFEHSKLVRVVKGEIQDVAVDLRIKSKTYKKYFSIILNDKNRKQLFIPKGFAHGFLVLSKTAIVSYKMDGPFNAKYNMGIRYDDSTIGINWMINENDIILSDKDKNLSFLGDL